MENLADISDPKFHQMSKNINKLNFRYVFIQVSMIEIANLEKLIFPIKLEKIDGKNNFSKFALSIIET